MRSEEDPKARRKRIFYRVRVGILLFVLFVVILYAIRDFRSRGARKNWDQTLEVALVVVRVEGTQTVDDAALAALRGRVGALETRLASEMTRYRAGSPPPFHFSVLGPVTVSSPPPTPSGDGPTDLAKQAIALAGWLRETDPRAGVVSDRYDTRIYLAVRRPRSQDRSVIEGQSEEGGRVGVVEVELDDTMADLTLFVVTHELMHTLGASDKYDETGRSRAPDGLAEPNRSPLYPQRFAEVMARNVPVSPSSERVPETIDELAVGALTASEIGWTLR